MFTPPRLTVPGDERNLDPLMVRSVPPRVGPVKGETVVIIGT
jgi:hypothetical protein